MEFVWILVLAIWYFMTITNNVKKHREERKLTQDELAHAVGVSRQTICAMERGNYEPSLGLALKLSGFFKVKVEDLFMLR